MKTDEIRNVKDAEEIIAQKEALIREKYAEIGELYCKLHGADAEDEFKGLVAEVADAETDIAACGNRILKLKGLVICKQCGAQVKENSVFCKECGCRMKEIPAPNAEPKTEPETVVCSSCGSTVKAGTRFCIRCGKPLVPKQADEDAVPTVVRQTEEDAPKSEEAPAAEPQTDPEAPAEAPAPETVAEKVQEAPVEAEPKKSFVSEYDLDPAGMKAPKQPFVSEYDLDPAGVKKPKEPFVSEYDLDPAGVKKPKEPFVSEYETDPSGSPKPKKPFVSDYADDDYAVQPPVKKQKFVSEYESAASVPAVPVALSEPEEKKPESDAGAVCSKCGSSIKPGMKFCIRCGTPVSDRPQKPERHSELRRCPKCSKVIDKPDARFCTGCGTKLG